MLVVSITQRIRGCFSDTASFGIAGFQASKDKTFAELLIRADKALYSAKSAGRNQVVAAVDREFVLRG